MAGAIQTTQLEKPSLTAKKNQQDPSKFYYHFMYKAVTIAIFLVVLPLFPSQAPEFINQQSLLTRNWELLHLVFVGIAISYGLFSRRRDEKTEKEQNNSKFDIDNDNNAHCSDSVVSRFLQVPSFFEVDEAENESESPSYSELQTWSIQHRRNKPTVVVAPQHSGFDEMPLLLPVRSLKSRVSDSDPAVGYQSAAASVSSAITSNSGSRRFSTIANKARRNGEVEGFCEGPKVEDKRNGKVVVPSPPIPWRSSLMDQESRSIKSQKSRSSRPSSVSSSPSLFSPCFSSESLAKNAEDLMRKKGFCKSSPPPPPPPPPPIFQKSSTSNSMVKVPRPSSFNKGDSFDKELKRSFTSERNDLKQRSSTGHNKLMGRASAPLVSVESDEDDPETEDEEVGGEKFVQKERGESSVTDTPPSSSSNGGDVDKKADEFIAKFREQIRLQRIDSIKRSARIHTRNSPR